MLCGLSETEDFHEIFSLDSDGSYKDFFTLSSVKLIIKEGSFSKSNPDICDNDTKTVINQKNDADDAVNGSTYRPMLANTADVVKILIGFSISTLRSKSKLSNEAENDQTSTVHLYKKCPFISSIDAAQNKSNLSNYDRIHSL